MSARRRISTKERTAIFMRHHGVCHMCGLKIEPGQEWDVSHEIPLELGGEDGGENTKPAHRKCHRDHTAKHDAPRIAKAKRQSARHIGATQPKGQIQSAGFPKPAKPSRNGAARIEKTYGLRWNAITGERLQ
jgi:5-methylcytosine-specific restriction endonuclease McrA